MIVKVLINTSVKKLNKVYDYLVSEEMIPEMAIGKRVSVNFGRGRDRCEEGIVVKIEKDEYIPSFNLKPIVQVLDQVSYIEETKLSLAKWMAYVYFCNVYDCLKLMLPPGTNTIAKSKILKAKEETVVLLAKEADEILTDIEEEKITSAKHILLLKFLIENDYVTLADIVEGLNVSKAIVTTLVKNGYIMLEKTEIKVDIAQDLKIDSSSPLVPTFEQQQAIDGITKQIETKEYSENLLFGVTGSGKTEVYLQVIEKVLQQGRNVIVLVPEISLTHQTFTRFISRFGNVVSCLHSRMTISKRKEEYRKIATGEIKIVIGARSAIFAPIQNIGMIIIDEEHDSSYYSSSTPKYDTKEVASYLCKTCHATLLFGSATPEVSSYYKTQIGKCNLFTLASRPGGAVLPEIIMVDKKQDALNNQALLSSRLQQEIILNKQRDEQTMIFINRRGYSSYLTCRACQTILKCPNCDVAMTYHKKSNLLLCHYCSHVERNIVVCPVCGANELKDSSFGTQKIEEEITRLIPDCRVLRMDRDTTILKDAHTKILEEFKEKKIDVLIGTQMISKGHDIENVTLVGVLGSDSLLNMNHYLASERAYSNISQVAGRAGRGSKSGRTVIETAEPDNPILLAALHHDYLTFYQQEIAFRKAFSYPPFMDLMQIELSSKDNQALKQAADILYDIMKETDGLYTVYSPKAPFIEKVNNKYRMNMILKTKINTAVLKKLYENSKRYDAKRVKNVSVTISKNPMMIG